jgi:hypothetical protein
MYSNEALAGATKLVSINLVSNELCLLSVSSNCHGERERVIFFCSLGSLLQISKANILFEII